MHKSPLLDQMLELEKEYVGLFSEAIENDGTIRYIDSALPDMHTHNFIWYNSKQGLGEFVTEQI
ncbi:hypothetical protein [Gracilibacillus massiliensis]|uniref:hypothetical protein n=1 Tax=Gracilibacillus massiliensis TaxID=1564956 RepID=UPI00071D70BA|nr:hypothetical protein [Gracilibacillus massiliensis]